MEFSEAVYGGPIEQSILDFVSIRASQQNGCAFCLDIHSKEAKLHGEHEHCLYHLPAWRESPLFNPRERTALPWIEILRSLRITACRMKTWQRPRRFLRKRTLQSLLRCDEDQRVEPGEHRRFLLGIWPRFVTEMERHFVDINGSPGLLMSLNGQVQYAFSFETDGARIRNIHLSCNPDKLRHLARTGKN